MRSQSRVALPEFCESDVTQSQFRVSYPEFCESDVMQSQFGVCYPEFCESDVMRSQFGVYRPEFCESDVMRPQFGSICLSSVNRISQLRQVSHFWYCKQRSTFLAVTVSLFSLWVGLISISVFNVV